MAGFQGFGLIFPQDLTTGALGIPWVSDRVSGVAETSSAQTPHYTVEYSATGPTDTNLRDPPVISATFQCSNAIQPTSLRPDFNRPGRAQAMADEFDALRDREGAVAVSLPGFPLLRDRTIGTTSRAVGDDLEEILITVEFARVDYATLQTVPVAQDADLLALGSQITSGGTL